MHFKIYITYVCVRSWPMTSQNKSTVNLAFVTSLSQKPSVQLEARHRHSAVMAGCVTVSQKSSKMATGFNLFFFCDLWHFDFFVFLPSLVPTIEKNLLNFCNRIFSATTCYNIENQNCISVGFFNSDISSFLPRSHDRNQNFLEKQPSDCFVLRLTSPWLKSLIPVFTHLKNMFSSWTSKYLGNQSDL